MYRTPRVLLIPALAICGLAADLKQEEQAIRAIVAQEEQRGERPAYTDDVIFTSGAFPRPLFGEKARKEAVEQRQQDPKTRRRNQAVKHDIVRIEVADSGNMAYEFTNFRLGYDDTENKRVEFDGSFLRVWRKVDGKWKVAALAARPHRGPEASAR